MNKFLTIFMLIGLYDLANSGCAMKRFNCFIEGELAGSICGETCLSWNKVTCVPCRYFDYVMKCKDQVNMKSDEAREDMDEFNSIDNRVQCSKHNKRSLHSNHDMSIDILKNALESQQIMIEKLQTELGQAVNTVPVAAHASTDQLVPIGYIYTQYPGQDEPNTLWPKATWKDITEKFAGNFFRAEGGDSGSFGELQEENHSWISKVEVFAEKYHELAERKSSVAWQEFELKDASWSDAVDPYGHLISAFRFYKTGGENRPINRAVRIWKRVQ